MPLFYRKENFLFLKKLLQAKPDHFVRGSTLIETAPWPGTIVTIGMSCFMTGDPDKE